MIIKCKNKSILSNISIIQEIYDKVQGWGSRPGTSHDAHDLYVDSDIGSPFLSRLATLPMTIWPSH